MSQPEEARPRYIVHFFLGLAESEEQKLCRWSQWEQCYLVLDEILKPFGAKANLSSDQDYVVALRNYKSDPPSTRRVTYKTVPHISRLRWTHEANRVWTSTLEGNEAHPVVLNRTRIASSKIGIPKYDGSGREIPEICILLGDQEPAASSAAFNQSLMLAVSERLYATRPVDYWNGLIARLSLLIRAVRVGRTSCPWSQGITVNGSMVSTCVGHDSYAIRNTLDFNSYFHQWEYLPVMEA
jgi:hypothetical protein